ncbi:helix-turn-helix transcriptional regulator [Dysgonomonas sp. Marseille-P4677]|uniref:helix-turn-helix transcriptional regulator n=1 Tax=Dysgonomonas sp. Marseille-P4677 TaxID=2364790 RepID=UPI0019121D3B|nr:helix-turn-helix transcriptional regulator [Dysgonomonas sp. Marseille-P4677]MBK5722756.1 helix-turn-helix transcriptional regulator [Dysgonomonas sp. Marseille-P4677]
MDSLYSSDSQSYTNYGRGESPTIDNLNLSKGQIWPSRALNSKVVFVTNGTLSISYDKTSKDKLPKGTILLLAIGCQFNIYAEEDTSLVIVYLPNKPNNEELTLYKLLFKDILSEKHYNADHLPLQIKNTKKNDVYYLTIKECLWTYLENLNERIKDGLKSDIFFELKLKELFLLLRAYYSKEELFNFFAPLQHWEQDFYSTVINNFHNVKTIKELADLTNYSISGFEKKFKRIFNISAGNWIKQQKSMAILNEISNEETPFKNICFQNGFSSLSHFNNYCKLHFGQTPGEIRRNKKGKK